MARRVFDQNNTIKSMLNITFDENNFRKIFPFFVVIDRDLKIIDHGPSMNKILEDLNGRKFEDVFEFVRPKLSIENTFESFLDHQNIVIILESKEYPLKTRFRGQFIFIENDQKLIYINSPWITNVLDLGFHNLLISDFAIHDTITDNLQLLQSKEIVNDDMKKIADELIVQRDELLEKNQTILELARFPDQNPQPILRLDMDGRVMYANDPAVVLITNNNLMEQPFWGAIHLKFERNNYATYEREFKLGDKIFHATMVPIRENNYFNVYLRDITQTILYQNELLSTSSRLYSLINSMHSAVLAESDERKIILVNQIFCDLFEIPMEAEQMKGFDCSQAAEQSKHLFEDEVGFVDRIDWILANRERVYGDILRMKNGKILERDYVPIYEHGVYIGHIWKYQDITEVYNSKESLRKVEEKYRKIIENLNFGLIEVDLNENITKAYPEFCKLTGYTEEELLGTNAKKLLAFDENLIILDQQAQLRKQGISSVYETKIRAKDGSIRWVIISGAPIFGDNNQVIGSLGIHIDITDRKKLEQDLIRANEIANSSVEAKKLFLANMSHEIRTPMNVIIGMSELLKETILDKDQQKYVSTINRSGENLMELINDLLDFSKIEAGYITLDQSSVNIRELFDHLELSFYEKAKQKGVALEKYVDPEITNYLTTDGSKLNQVMVNLISNAIKFTDKGHVKFSAELLSGNKHRQKILFTIEDTGIGISSENLKNVFQNFIQEDATISRKYGGTGLGLSISQGIVDSMGGQIEVESAKGVGSKFSFYLEFVIGEREQSVENGSSKNKSQLKDIKILVAEDNPLNQTLIKAILTKEGVPFEIASNGLEVIHKLKESVFNLILMDIQMPEMDGITATEYIRQELRSEIPIVALTANASVEDRRSYMDAGMNDYLSKPFRKEELLDKILSFSVPDLHSDDQSGIDQERSSKNSYSLVEIEELSGGDDEFVLSIVDTFKSTIPGYLDQMEEAIAVNDLKTLRSLAHQIKPSLDVLLIKESGRLIRKLEEEATKEQSDTDLMNDLFDRIKGELTLVLEDMNSRFSK